LASAVLPSLSGVGVANLVVNFDLQPTDIVIPIRSQLLVGVASKRVPSVPSQTSFLSKLQAELSEQAKMSSVEQGGMDWRQMKEFVGSRKGSYLENVGVDYCDDSFSETESLLASLRKTFVPHPTHRISKVFCNANLPFPINVGIQISPISSERPTEVPATQLIEAEDEGLCTGIRDLLLKHSKVPRHKIKSVIPEVLALIRSHSSRPK
jgi:hypothetical protein